MSQPEESTAEWVERLNREGAGADDVDCGFACAYVEPYGFVPEADCPVHDAPRQA